MPRDVAVAFVHGIQATNFDYSEPMQRLILRSIPRKLRSHVKFRSVFWADIVRGRSQLYMHQACSATMMTDNKYRRLVVEGLGDAAAYQKTRNRTNSAYYEIQERINRVLRDADSPNDPTRPLIFVAHSLGCHIVSSYLWDINRLKQLTDEEVALWSDPEVSRTVSELRSASPFRRLDTVAGIATMGSNMPLFTFTFGPDKVYPIFQEPHSGKRPAFPGACLPDDLFSAAKWLNFYSPNDLLGYPMKVLNSAYNQEERLIDVPVWSEGRMRALFWPGLFNTYRAHLGYWRNPLVVKHIAALIVNTMSSTARVELPSTIEETHLAASAS